MIRDAIAALGIFIALQVFGQHVLWGEIWHTGVDCRHAMGVWGAWTGLQIGIGVVVGSQLARAGLTLVRLTEIEPVPDAANCDWEFDTLEAPGAVAAA